MRRIVQVISTKRSAHHAFIQWFCRNAAGPVTFFNNITLSSPPRVREREDFHGGAAPVRIPGGDHERELVQGSTDVLVNIEGKSPRSVRQWTDGYLRRCVPGQLQRLVFLRDPVNTLASLAKRGRPGDSRSLFKYFYQVLALQQTIGQLPDPRGEFCDRVVLMSPWLLDAAYRRQLADDFGLEPGPPPAQVTRQGGGSSFGGRTYDPGADSAALHQRWRGLESDPLFLAPFADQPSVAAMQSYFRLFGTQEPFDPAVIDVLQERAAGNPAAGRYARRVLAPLRRAARSLDAMETAPHLVVRHLWRAAVVGRFRLLLHF